MADYETGTRNADPCVSSGEITSHYRLGRIPLFPSSAGDGRGKVGVAYDVKKDLVPRLGTGKPVLYEINQMRVNRTIVEVMHTHDLPLESVIKLRIVVPDEEKSAAGLFFDRRLGTKNTPRADFDEVWRGETHFNNTFL